MTVTWTSIIKLNSTDAGSTQIKKRSFHIGYPVVRTERDTRGYHENFLG